MLKRNVEIGQHQALRHQFHHRVDMGIGIDIVQPDPRPQPAKLARKIVKLRLHIAIAKPARGIADVEPVGAGVLRDDEQLLHPRLHQPGSLAQHLARRARHQVAAQFRDDAEGAAVVAALRNLQIGVMARRQLDALRRHQVGERVVQGRGGAMHRRHHALVGLRPGDLQHIGEGRQNRLRLGAHASRDDDLAILLHRRADGGERLGLGAVEEAAGVHDHGIGPGVAARQFVALGAQLRDDAFGINKRLRAAERNKRDFGEF